MISVRESDSVFRCDPEVLREGFGRVTEDIVSGGVVRDDLQSYQVVESIRVKPRRVLEFLQVACDEREG